MSDDAAMEAAASALISSPDTSAEDRDLLQPNLPMLAATHISVCRKLVLQQAVEALGFSMKETTAHDDESNEVLTAIEINVPPHIHVARLETRLFYGDWSTTSVTAVQSACSNALAYLQKVKVLVIDGIHSADLRQCEKQLLRTSSWVDAFESHVQRIQPCIFTKVPEKKSGLPIPHATLKIGSIPQAAHSERPAGSAVVSTGKQVAVHQQLLPPSASALITHTVRNKEVPYWIPLADKRARAIHPHYARLLHAQNAKQPVPHPTSTLAASNRAKRRFILHSQRSRVEAPALPSPALLDELSSQNMSSSNNDLSDQHTCAESDNVDPKSIFASGATPPSNKWIHDLSMRTIQVDSKVRRSMFQDDEDRASSTGLRDEKFPQAHEADSGADLCLGSTVHPTPLVINERHDSEPAAFTPAVVTKP